MITEEDIKFISDLTKQDSQISSLTLRQVRNIVKKMDDYMYIDDSNDKLVLEFAARIKNKILENAKKDRYKNKEFYYTYNTIDFAINRAIENVIEGEPVDCIIEGSFRLEDDVSHVEEKVRKRNN